MQKLVSIPTRSPWVTFLLVLRALMLRQMATRFGAYKLGFFWMIFEPLVSVIVVGIVIGGIAGRTVPEIPYPFFLLLGFLMLKLVSGPMSTGVGVITANRGLLVYSSVRPLDVFIARFLFDLFTTLLAFVIFCIAGMWMGIEVSLQNLHIVLASFVIIWFVGCGVGLILGLAVLRFNDLDKLVPVLNRPLVFVSAVLFPLDTLPESIQKILLYNPLVHTIEISRTALFPNYVEHGANLAYPSVVAVILLAIGLAYYHRCRKLLVSN
ncbi:MAG: ABC transporter permease [Verrucomicrobiota bacterium]